jgi:hypothetical protein
MSENVAVPTAVPTAAVGNMPPPVVVPNDVCRCCGSTPVAHTTFRGHQGFIILMRFLSLKGPFCRDCGLATFRRMTSRTLVQGWWGYGSFVITPITVLINLARRNKVASLPAPQPTEYNFGRQPLDPGPPVLQRPMGIAGVVIGVAVISLVIALFTH